MTQYIAQRLPRKTEVYNVGNQDYISALEVVVGSSKIDYQTTGGQRGWRGDIPHLRCDLSKIKMLEWQPSCNSATAVAQAASLSASLSHFCCRKFNLILFYYFQNAWQGLC